MTVEDHTFVVAVKAHRRRVKVKRQGANTMEAAR
jgi:hypothetical protein